MPNELFKNGIWTDANYRNAHPIPGSHLHIPTEQAGPEFTERDAPPSLIRTFIPSNGSSDSRGRQS